MTKVKRAVAFKLDLPPNRRSVAPPLFRGVEKCGKEPCTKPPDLFVRLKVLNRCPDIANAPRVHGMRNVPSLRHMGTESHRCPYQLCPGPCRSASGICFVSSSPHTHPSKINILYWQKYSSCHDPRCRPYRCHGARRRSLATFPAHFFPHKTLELP